MPLLQLPPHTHPVHPRAPAELYPESSTLLESFWHPPGKHSFFLSIRYKIPHADHGLHEQAVIRVAGTGVSPFNTTKQATLIVSLASVMTTVTQDEIGIILVQAATSTDRRRSLLSIDVSDVSPVADPCWS